MQIIAVRHASTWFNEQELINGQIDEGLSPKGLGQIHGLIESLAVYDFTNVYCSTMKRSVQMAGPIARHYKLPLKKDARSAEVDLGSFQITYAPAIK